MLERQLKRFEQQRIVSPAVSEPKEAPPALPRPPSDRPKSESRRANALRAKSAKSVRRDASDVDTAPLERREPTVELDELQDLHESVHDSQTGLMSTATKGLTSNETAATSELMGQLSALRKRLEGEQKRVNNQMKADEGQLTKLADQSRQRKIQQDRLDEADDVVSEVLAQLEEAQADIDVKKTTPSNAVFVRDGEDAKTPPPDEDVLNAFNQMKYNSTGTDNAQASLMKAFPEPPGSEVALDTQQRALIQAQERELDLLRNRLGESTFDRNATLASIASTGSFNLDIVTAKNEERLRRLNNTTTGHLGRTSPQDVLSHFLHDTASKGLSSELKYNDPLPAESLSKLYATNNSLDF